MWGVERVMGWRWRLDEVLLGGVDGGVCGRKGVLSREGGRRLCVHLRGKGGEEGGGRGMESERD